MITDREIDARVFASFYQNIIPLAQDEDKLPVKCQFVLDLLLLPVPRTGSSKCAWGYCSLDLDNSVLFCENSIKTVFLTLSTLVIPDTVTIRIRTG